MAQRWWLVFNDLLLKAIIKQVLKPEFFVLKFDRKKIRHYFVPSTRRVQQFISHKYVKVCGLTTIGKSSTLKPRHIRRN